MEKAEEYQEQEKQYEEENGWKEAKIERDRRGRGEIGDEEEVEEKRAWEVLLLPRKGTDRIIFMLGGSRRFPNASSVAVSSFQVRIRRWHERMNERTDCEIV